MQTQVSEISPVLVEVKVEVPWDLVSQQIDASLTRVQREAKVKGFRPGKVPRNVAKQLFGQQVKAEVTGMLVEQGFVAAVKEHSLEVVAEPRIERPSLTDGAPLTFTAKVEVRPKVGHVETSGITLYRDKVEVPDADVTNEVERLREQQATLRTPDPVRPAQAGDVVTLDYHVAIDGAPRPDLSASDRKVELNGEALIPGFSEAITGMSAGETKEATIPLPADHARQDLRGKQAAFTLHAKDVQEKILPEVDDEFAKDCGNYETLLELRLAIRKRLEEGVQRKIDGDLREQALDGLIEKNPVPVPPTLVLMQQRQLLREFAQLLQMSGQKPPPMTEELQKTIELRAQRHVRAAILLGALAREHKISVAAADMDKRYQEIAERSGKHIAKVRVDYSQPERREALESQILEDKLMEYLLAQATIADGPRPEAPKAEQGVAETASAPEKTEKTET